MQVYQAYYYSVELDLESIKSSLKMDFEKGGISIRIDRDS